jgi:hypothetical protein
MRIARRRGGVDRNGRSIPGILSFAATPPSLGSALPFSREVGEGERELSLLQKQFLDISTYPPHGFRNEVATEGERAMGGDGSAFRKNRVFQAFSTLTP